ncbi:mCG147620 [Mus musculus]|nr:mCG147620 [Mus musculus]
MKHEEDSCVRMTKECTSVKEGAKRKKDKDPRETKWKTQITSNCCWPREWLLALQSNSRFGRRRTYF